MTRLRCECAPEAHVWGMPRPWRDEDGIVWIAQDCMHCDTCRLSPLPPDGGEPVPLEEAA